MRLPALTAALALLFVLPAAAAPPPAAGLTLIDLTPQFAQAYEATKALPDDQKVAAVDAAFAPLLPGFYDPARRKAGAKYDARLLRALNTFPAQRKGIEEVSRRFAEMLAPAQASFEARFGPMTGYPPIYLLHSLGEFDGGTRDLPQGTRLLFGADMIALLHTGDHAIQPFFHHELFHILHQRRFPGCDQLWCGLWSEGLAVYVAEQLNPGATDEALLLTVPAPIRPAVEKDRAAAVCAVRQRLDSTDPKDSDAMFSFGRLGPGLPPRFGYYVGYLVAQDLGRTRSLPQLARLDQAQARPLVEAALKRLAPTCAPAS